MAICDEILNLDDGSTETVEIPEWNRSLIVRSLTADEVEAFRPPLDEADRTQGNRTLQARLAVATVIDATGAPVFTEAHVQQLAGKSQIALDRISEAALRLSGLAPGDAAARKEAVRHVMGLFHMAERLKMTVTELMRRMGPVQREAWRLYYELVAEDMQHGQLAMRANQGMQRAPTPHGAGEFMSAEKIAAMREQQRAREQAGQQAANGTGAGAPAQPAGQEDS